LYFFFLKHLVIDNTKKSKIKNKKSKLLKPEVLRDDFLKFALYTLIF